MASPPAKRRSLSQIATQYDRLARHYRLIEPLFLLFPSARRMAVTALELKPGDTVVELGAGTGRNLPYLVDAVGPEGAVIAVDASAGMLAEARRLIARRGWSNVELIEGDAARVKLDREVDAVLFSLSYSVLPEPEVTLARAWERMRPTARLVVMDAGLPDTRLGRFLRPVAPIPRGVVLGDPYARPWDDLAGYGPPVTERFLLGLFYVTTVVK